MNKIKKYKGLIIVAILILIVSILVSLNMMVYAASELPAEDNEKITLTENVTLTGKFVVPAGKTLTIDLAGCTLQGPTGNYTIENNGNLTITSSKAGGKIIGVATSSSCIQNTGKLNVENITVDSKYNGIKNDEGGILTVDNCKIYSTYKWAAAIGAILNWGDATINNSTIQGKSKSVGVYAMSGYQAGTDSNSKIVLNNCNIKSEYHAIYSKRYNSSSTKTTTVEVNNGSISGGKPPFYNDSDNGSILVISGKVSAPIEVLDYLTKGSTLVLNKKNSSGKNRTIPEGITLDVSKVSYVLGKNDKLVVNGELVGNFTGAKVYNATQKAYYYKLSNAIPKVECKDGEPEVLIMNQINSELNAITIPEGMNIVIDLNGKKLTSTINNSNGSTLTIKDSSEEKTGIFKGNVLNPENGTILIEDGDFDATKTITNKGNLVIKGGKFGVMPVTEEGGTTTLEGGIYTIADMNVEGATGVKIPETMQVVKKEDGTYTIGYKDGDYSKVEEAIKQAQALNKENYKDFTAVDNAINSVVYGKDMSEQATIDGYAQAITDAINGLVEVEKKDDTQPSEPGKTDDTEDNKENEIGEGENNIDGTDAGGKDSIKSPKTGDNVLVWMGVLVASTAGLVTIRKCNVKKSKHSK